jgi:DNA/RNA-binding domain of Phe-tRNA-synthetase-like protein
MQLELDHPTLALALVSADVCVQPTCAALSAELAELETALADDPSRYPEAVRSAVRDVLRRGGYKPTGRGKPASEYLLGQAQARALPRINNLVDICNLVSLRHGLPISVFDAALLGDDLALRFGRDDEPYVFNASGQSMDIEGLPVVCRGAERQPVGNAVKDSMHCKVRPETRRALYVVYASRQHSDVLGACVEDLVRALVLQAPSAQPQVSFFPPVARTEPSAGRTPI